MTAVRERREAALTSDSRPCHTRKAQVKVIKSE